MIWTLDAEWIWLGAGLLLLILELATGSLFLLWPGIAALCVAAIAYLAPGLAVHIQLLIFAAIAVATTYLGRGYFKGRVGAAVSDRPLLNRRGAQLEGRRVWAIAAFDHGEGRVRLGDSQWSARLDSQDAAGGPAPVAEGAPLTILRVEGSVLIVAPDVQQATA